MAFGHWTRKLFFEESKGSLNVEPGASISLADFTSSVTEEGTSSGAAKKKVGKLKKRKHESSDDDDDDAELEADSIHSNLTSEQEDDDHDENSDREIQQRQTDTEELVEGNYVLVRFEPKTAKPYHCRKNYLTTQ